MKYAVRMVIIPELEYLQLKQQKPTPGKLPKTRQAFIKHTQELGRQIRERAQAAEPSTAAEVTPPTDPRRSTPDIVEHLPRQYRDKARRALSEMANHGFSWKYNREVQLPSGQLLSGSNIVDLLKEAIDPKTSSNPRGWSAFITSIADSAIPRSLFSKSSTKRALQQVEPVPLPSPSWEAY